MWKPFYENDIVFGYKLSHPWYFIYKILYGKPIKIHYSYEMGVWLALWFKPGVAKGVG